MTIIGSRAPHSPPQQRRGHNHGMHKQQHAARKFSLSSTIRALYWGMFLLLFMTTFLRTSIDNSHTGSMAAPGNRNHAPTNLQSSFRNTNRRPAPERRPPHKRRMAQFEDTDDGVRSGAAKPGILPGMHNPSLEIFHQDAGEHVPDEYFLQSTHGQSSAVAQLNNLQLENIVSNTNQNIYGNKQRQSIDWRTVLQKHEFQKAASPDLGQRSPFVKKLYALEEALMRKANSTKTSSPSIPDNWRNDLAKTPADQPIDFVTPILPAPTRIHHNASRHNMIVLVLSHHGSFIKRQAIRETWAENHANVLFVVAQSGCAEFEYDLAGNEVTYVDENGKEIDNNTSTAPSNNITRCDEIDHNFLRLEQEKYQDLLEIPMKEKYNRLPEKLLQAYHWVLRNAAYVEWIVKSDDDMFVRVGNLERYLKKYNPNIPMVIGEIIHHSKVNPIGKWAELDYPSEYYPFWPKGSAGHVISRAAAKYFSDTSETLHRYQGEDTSVGIWLDEARKNKTLEDVTYIHANNMFESRGEQACSRPKYMIVGHDLRPDELLECYLNYTHTFTEKAWLDDPSGFEDMIRQEMGYSAPVPMKWRPAVEYQRETPGLSGPGSTSYGLKGTLTKAQL